METVGQTLNRAWQMHQRGDYTQAELLYRQIVEVQPEHTVARFLLGRLELDTGRHESAVEHLSAAVEGDASQAVYHATLARAQQALGQHRESVRSYRAALALEPDGADYHVNLGNALLLCDESAEAIASYEKAIEHDPQLAEAYNCLGSALGQQGRVAEALANYRRAIELDPSDPQSHYNLGTTLLKGQAVEAAESFEAAVRLQPNWGTAQANLGAAYHALGRNDEAQQAIERAIQIEPDHAEAHYNLGCVLLLRGDFERGWREHAWRLRMPQHKAPGLGIPQWDGSPLSGKRLLVYGEQGLGDTMQFVRYLPPLEDRAAEVVLMVQPAIIPLLTAAGITNLVPHNAEVPPCDAQCALLSLPALLGTTLDTIPAEIPYLRPDPNLVEQWRDLLAPIANRKVGIAWQGNTEYAADRFRSIPLTAFEPLADLPQLDLISLQVGQGAAQIDELDGRFEVKRFDDVLDVEHGAFMDTAAAMMNLDLVVTSDTAIAHLAGALGVPVFVALCTPPDWRWMLERSDSPWYPTMRLFRQQRPGDWAGVFEQIATELAAAD